jgi:hypothetical protein
MNWGKWIVVAFLIFTGFIATLVAICVKQDISLVSGSYYKDELVYQEQINRIQNVSELKARPEVAIVNGYLRLSFSQLPDVSKGELKLFRPSNASLDKTFRLQALATTTAEFEIGQIPKGMYRIKFQWTMHDREYYFEDVIYV